MTSALERNYCTTNGIPLPDETPEERMRLMCLFRPAHFLYRTRCAMTGKSILGSVPPDQGLTVYDVDSWLGSNWDPRSYGRDYDFGRPFFDQFRELLHSVPLPSLSANHASLENCGYCNFVTAAKNCYLVFSGQQLEDCMYGRFIYDSRDIVDCFYIRHSELCYGSRDLQNCYNVHFSEHSRHCFDSMFLSACQSCRSCFECVNLSNKQFCWRNEQLSEDEWSRRRAAVDLGSAAVLAERRASFGDFAASQPLRCVQGDRYENSSGNYLNQVADCSDCFIISESDSLADCIWVNKARSCILTVGFGVDSELIYNSTGVGTRAYNVKFCLQCRQSISNIEYCFLAEAGTHDCFGCISLRNGAYCILNKQYTADEYAALLPRIKDHMRSTGEYGKFFPASLAPYAYNESDAALFFPLGKAEAEARGYRWSDGEEQTPGTRRAPLPAHIDDAGDDAAEKTYACAVTGKGYKLQQKELELLRRIRVAPPAVSPFERIRQAGEFLRRRPVRTAACASCGGSCKTVYDEPARQIYCESCYSQLLADGN